MLGGLSTQPDSPDHSGDRVFATQMDPQLDQIIESLLFASPEPIESKTIARLVRNVARRRAAEEAEAAASEAEGEGDDEAALEPEQELVEDVAEVDEETESESEEPLDAATAAEEPDGSEEEMRPVDDLDENGEEVVLTGEDEDAPINLAKLSAAQVEGAIAKLNDYYSSTGRAFAVVARPNGWKLYSRPEFSPWLRELFPVKRSARLSPPALETLAIIAYRQPLTRAAIEAVRGVAVDGVVNTLVERGLIQIAGRAELPGRPLLYETTSLFFEHFNIRTIDDLPNAAELRQVKLPEPESETDTEEEENEEQDEFNLDPSADSESADATSEPPDPQAGAEDDEDDEDDEDEKSTRPV